MSWKAVRAAPGHGSVDVRHHAVIGVAMLAVCSGLGAGTLWLLPVPTMTRLVASVVFAVTGTVVWSTLLLPWRRLPHQLLLLYPLSGLGSLGVLGVCTTGVGPVYLGFIVFPFIVMGFSGSIRGVFALLPSGAVTWLLLNGVPEVAMSAAFAVRLGISLSVWAVVGVVLARRSNEERHQQSELTEDAHTDPLTGLDNRRALVSVLERVGAGDVVIAVDLDEFREINAARGHGGGDAVLAEFGRTIRVGLRGGDHAIRQGGDEFVLVLSAVSDVQVLTILGRLKDRWQQQCGPVTFSAGAAAFRPGETGHDTLLRADENCYRAKTAGRDQWMLDDTDSLTVHAGTGPGLVGSPEDPGALAERPTAPITEHVSGGSGAQRGVAVKPAPAPRSAQASAVSAVLVVVAGLAVYVLAGVDGRGTLAAVVYSVMASLGIVAMGVRTERMRVNRAPWVLLTAGAGLLIVCQLALMWHGSAQGSSVELRVVREHPGIAMSGLVAYPVLYAGQMVLLRQRVEQLFPSAWLDGLLAALMLGAVALAFAGPTLSHRFDLTNVAVAAVAGRPTLDALLASFALANWRISGRRADRRLPVLAIVFLVLTVADTVGAANLLGLLGTESGPTAALAVDTARLIVLMLLVAAASRSPAIAKEPMPEGSAVLIGPILSLVCGVGLVVFDRYHRVETAALYLALIAVTGVGVKFILVFREVVKLAETRRQALTDDLTGLANRRALTKGLDDATSSTGTADVSLLVVDLDGFKAVNDRHGHLVGDQLLRLVADQLRRVVPDSAVVARVGGDEFAVLLPGAELATAHALARGVHTALSDLPLPPRSPNGPLLPVQLPPVGASIGLAHTPAGTIGPPVRLAGDELLRRADLAMYVAKSAGGGVGIYDEPLDVAQQVRSTMLEELRSVLVPGPADGAFDPSGGSRQIVAFYQPQLDARTGLTVGVEALVRWHHPRLGLLAPAAFLDLAERHGLMPLITASMLQTAAEQAVHWRREGRFFRVSVNLSASSLNSPDLLPLLDHVLLSSGLPPEGLVLEITETTLMADPDKALDVTRRITARGVGLSIDDYGTGYSSLAYLNDLPATEIKLDQSFTRRLLHDDRTVAIVTATIDLAHRLGLGIVAEGVEDLATLHLLRQLGCDTTQGYLHSPPLTPADLSRWLARNGPAAPVCVPGPNRTTPSSPPLTGIVRPVS